jgi:hypothetical protein
MFLEGKWIWTSVVLCSGRTSARPRLCCALLWKDLCQTLLERTADKWYVLLHLIFSSLLCLRLLFSDLIWYLFEILFHDLYMIFNAEMENTEPMRPMEG